MDDPCVAAARERRGVDREPGADVERARSVRDAPGAESPAGMRVVDLERVGRGQRRQVVPAQRDLGHAVLREDRPQQRAPRRVDARLPSWRRTATCPPVRGLREHRLGPAREVVEPRADPFEPHRVDRAARIRRPVVDPEEAARADKTAEPVAGEDRADVAGPERGGDEPLARPRRRGDVEGVAALAVAALVDDPGHPAAGQRELAHPGSGAAVVGEAGRPAADARRGVAADVPDVDRVAARPGAVAARDVVGDTRAVQRERLDEPRRRTRLRLRERRRLGGGRASDRGERHDEGQGSGASSARCNGAA